MVTAVVLAGGRKKGLDSEEASSEAFITIGKRYMIEYVLGALQDSPYVDRIVISGPVTKLRDYLKDYRDIILVGSGNTAVQSFMKALEVIPGSAERVLVVTADVPLLTAQAVNDLILTCNDKRGDLFYPIVSREINEEKYPGVKRTYVTLKEGTFTGGNLLLVNPQVVVKCLPIAEEFVRLRKRPLALAGFIGWRLLVRYLLGRLSIKDAEEKVSELMGIKGVGVITSFPEIGIDVDKQSDLALVRRTLVH